ncbi:MAG: ABC transporter permease [Clostridia bacterium]|nr:ABC transporter permease [Clostridia bacterium]
MKNRKEKPNYSPEHAAYLKKEKNKKLIVHLSRVFILVAILGVWELFAQLKVINPFITSSPSRVCTTVASLYTDGTLFYHIGITLMETIIGFVLAVVVGYAIAVILWASETVRKVVEPYIVVLNSLPKIALGPLIIIWIGTGYDAIIFMTILVSVIVCIMNMLAGFIAVDKTKLTLMKSMGAGRLITLRKLIIPASLPALMNTLKVAVGLAWIGSIMGEYIVSKAGLGYLIVYGGQVFKLDLVMTATFILCILAGGMYGIIALVEKKVVK